MYLTLFSSPLSSNTAVLAEDGLFVMGPTKFDLEPDKDVDPSASSCTMSTSGPFMKHPFLSSGNLRSLACGNRFSIAATTSGELLTWETAKWRNPTKVNSMSHEKVVQVSAGDSFCLALTSNGRIFSMGTDLRGQLGRPPFFLPFAEITSLPSVVTRIASGKNHSLALDENGHVWSWGRNGQGQLGLGHFKDQSTPSKIDLPSRIVHIATGRLFSAALTEEGFLFTWGWSHYGELGIIPRGNKNTPQKVPIQEQVVYFCCGSSHTLALTATGRLYSWGWNANGSLGLGDSQIRCSPELISFAFDSKIAAVAAGSSHSLVVTKSGKIYFWGSPRGLLSNDGKKSRKFSESGSSSGSSSSSSDPDSGSDSSSDSDSDSSTGSSSCFSSSSDSDSDSSTGSDSSSGSGSGSSSDSDSDSYSDSSTYSSSDTDTDSDSDSESEHPDILVPELLNVPFVPKIFDQCGFPLQLKFSLLHLLSEHYSAFPDINRLGATLRIICNARTPKFLEFFERGFSSPATVLQAMIFYFYTDSAYFFTQLDPVDLCHLAFLCHALEIPSFVDLSRTLLVDSLTPENCYHVLLKCSELGISEEMDSVLWFIGKNRISPLQGILDKIFAHSPKLVGQAFNEILSPTLLPPLVYIPPFPPVLPSLTEDLERIFISGEFSDFQLSVGDIVLPLHKCLLSSWKYSEILFRDSAHTLQMPLETFKKILLFFYSGSISSISFQDAVYISSLSSFYLLEDTKLLHFCDSMVSSLLEANWMEASVLAIQLSNEDLKKRAMAHAPSSSSSSPSSPSSSSPNPDIMNKLQLLVEELQGLKKVFEDKVRTLEEALEELKKAMLKEKELPESS